MDEGHRILTVALHLALLAAGIINVFRSCGCCCRRSRVDQSLLPREWTLENFVTVQENFAFLRLLGNSGLLSVTITAIAVYTSCLAGFVLAKYRFRGRDAMFAFILSTMMIPWAVTIIPRYTMFAEAGLRDSWASIIIPAALNGFGIFMMRQSMSAVPDELLDAARVDGASEVYTFHRIILPLSTTAISALAIFQFLWVWEDYLWPYLMLSSQTNQVLAVGLRMFNERFAATAISIIPALTVYLILQRRFIAGVASAALKG